MNRFWCLERLKKSKILDHVLLAPCAYIKNKSKTSGKILTRHKMAKLFDKS